MKIYPWFYGFVLCALASMVSCRNSSDSPELKEGLYYDSNSGFMGGAVAILVRKDSAFLVERSAFYLDARWMLLENLKRSSKKTQCEDCLEFVKGTWNYYCRGGSAIKLEYAYPSWGELDSLRMSYHLPAGQCWDYQVLQFDDSMRISGCFKGIFSPPGDTVIPLSALDLSWIRFASQFAVCESDFDSNAVYDDSVITLWISNEDSSFATKQYHSLMVPANNLLYQLLNQKVRSIEHKIGSDANDM